MLFEVKLEASFYLDLLIKDSKFIFSNSCLDYLENSLIDSIRNLKNNQHLPEIIIGILKAYVKYRQMNNWTEIVNLLIDKYKENQNNSINQKANSQSYFYIINYILECYDGLNNKIINEEVKIFLIVFKVKKVFLFSNKVFYILIYLNFIIKTLEIK